MSTIEDRLEELTFVRSPHMILCEYIPLGPNQFDYLSRALSAHRRDELFITSSVDLNPNSPCFEVGEDIAYITIVDFREGEYIRFLTDIRFREEEPIRQEEKLGVSIYENGTIFYSAKIEKCMVEGSNPIPEQFTENISLDRLARIVVDLMEDSSSLMHCILTAYQKRILSVVYPKSHEKHYERKKLVVIITDKIIYEGKELTEKVREQEDLELLIYQDSGFRREIQQILGDIEGGLVVGEDIIVKCRDGLLILTKNEAVREYKTILKRVLPLMALDEFYSHVFARIWVIWDRIDEFRKALEHAEGGESISELRVWLSKILSDVVILTNVDYIVKYSLRKIKADYAKFKGRGSLSSVHKAIIDLVDPDYVLDIIREKIMATRSLLDSFKMDIDGLTDLIGSFLEKEMRELRKAMYESIDKQTHIAELEHAAGESLEMIEFLSGGLLIAEILSLIFMWLSSVYGWSLGGWEYLMTAIITIVFAILLKRIVSMVTAEGGSGK